MSSAQLLLYYNVMFRSELIPIFSIIIDTEGPIICYQLSGLPMHVSMCMYVFILYEFQV